MSALVMLSIDSNKSMESISDYLNPEFPKQVLSIREYVPSPGLDSYKQFWNIRPTIEIWLSRDFDRSGIPNSYLIGFAMLDWLAGDMVLTYDGDGIFVRRNGRLIVSPRVLSDDGYWCLLKGRRFDFANVGQRFNQLFMQDESWHLSDEPN